MRQSDMHRALDRIEDMSIAFPKNFLKRWCEERSIPVELVTMRCNRPPAVKLRKEALLAFRERYPTMSFPAMARIFKRDHTTIMSALGLRSRGTRRTK